jgi:hypothetical protein
MESCWVFDDDALRGRGVAKELGLEELRAKSVGAKSGP